MGTIGFGAGARPVGAGRVKPRRRSVDMQAPAGGGDIRVMRNVGGYSTVGFRATPRIDRKPAPAEPESSAVERDLAAIDRELAIIDQELADADRELAAAGADAQPVAGADARLAAGRNAGREVRLATGADARLAAVTR
ncbi:hypothetical protein [Nocardia wallacei]|uniref:hypothetical protein n=1 Tax=Nocardia wallacei TaxID=480035 RepID=UPI0024546A82|nr:hypothetical protein [Nocardia wallacei]